jgi:hypothetical protein
MTRHYSKIDWWLVFLLLLALFYAVSYVVLPLLRGNQHVAWWGAGFFFLIAVLIGFMSWPLYYDISEGLLTIRMGIVRWRIHLDSIQTAVPTRAPWKAPALSLDRIQINYRKGWKKVSVLVSPKDKEGFLNDLVRYSKCLKRSGAQAVNTGRLEQTPQR